MMLDSRLSGDIETRLASTRSWAERHPRPAAARGGKTVMVAFGCDETRERVGELVTRQAEAGVLACASVEDCRALLAEQRVNALLLDMALPGEPGPDGDEAPPFCAELRGRAFRPPILLFGRCEAPGTAISALDAGATDYLQLPLKPAVFLARLRAHLRQHDESDFVAYQVGPFDFLPGDRLLLERESGRKLRLTAIETRIVRVLLQRPGSYADREDLMVALWGESGPRASHAIDSHVYRMRQKIEPDPKAPSWLVTEGKAYRLVL